MRFARHPSCPQRRFGVGQLLCHLWSWTLVAWLSFGVILPSAVLAQGGSPTAGSPPKEPILRIETGMHGETINRVAVDPSGRLIATVSDDKTLRLWTLDGQLQRIFRVPIAQGPEGMLYAVAFSKDGSQVAVGGYTGTTWSNGRTALYLFTVESGKMQRLLTPFSGGIQQLAFSPLDDALTIAFGGGTGLVILDPNTKQVRTHDKEYPSQGASWMVYAPDGRLFTSAFDGDIRVYGTDGKRERRVPAPGGKQPRQLAVSPDGGLVAVGYNDKVRVDVLRSRDLTLAYSPSVEGLQVKTQGPRQAEHLGSVAWAPGNGTLHLLATGYIPDVDHSNRVRRWRDFGLGSAEDQAISNDTIFQLDTLPDHSVVYAAADPAWGIFKPDGKIGAQRTEGNADFRDIAQGSFGWSADRLTVGFGTKSRGRAPYRFSFATRELEAGMGAEPALIPPRRSSPKIPMDFKDPQHPRIANIPVKLESHEWARSVALPADDSFVLLGTDRYLRLLSPAGQERTKLELPAAIWGVIVDPKGEMAVAALGDGTLSWFQIEGASGTSAKIQRLVTVLPRMEERQWIAWTPEGFFDHSDSGGKDLIGYHLNRGAGQSGEFISFAQLYSTFYAPDLVAGAAIGKVQPIRDRMLQIGDAQQLLEQAPPPEVRIVGYCYGASATETCQDVQADSLSRGLARDQHPDTSKATQTSATTPVGVQIPLPTGVTSVRLRYGAVDKGAGIGPIDLFVNDRNLGREMAPGRGLGRADSPAPRAQTVPAAQATTTLQLERSFTLEPGTNAVALRVYDERKRVYGTSNEVTFILPPTTEAKPVLHVVAIGVDSYVGTGIPPLRFAVADAFEFAKHVEIGAKSLYADVKSYYLKNGEAIRVNVQALLEKVAKESKPQDTVIIYLAGHGIIIDNKYRFLTQNVLSSRDEDIINSAVDQDSLMEWWSNIRPRNSLLILDTCHAGGFSLDFAGRLSHETGRFVLAASTDRQQALDGFDGKNGLFAHAALAALRGKHGTGTLTNAIDQLTLGGAVKVQVPLLAKTKSWSQSAVFKVRTEDLEPFPIVRIP